jgi:homoserine O-acetyltransferase
MIIRRASRCYSAAPLQPLQTVSLSKPLKLHLGGEDLHGIRVDAEVHGELSLPPSRTVLILPSFSHSAHVASNRSDPSRGWWEPMVGAGKAVDTRKWRVICLSVLGSHFGPTNPASPRPGAAPARSWRADFPQLTPTDLARCHRLALEALGVLDGPGGAAAAPAREPLHAVVGASLGGMQALQFGSLFPGDVRRLVAVACTGRTTPFTVALRRSQRRAILADPEYRDGDYADFGSGRGPVEGLRLARELGTILYRSREEFDARFDWSPSSASAAKEDTARAVHHFTKTASTANRTLTRRRLRRPALADP